MKPIFPSPGELTIMQLLHGEPEGLYAAQIAAKSNGRIELRPIYISLGRLVTKRMLIIERPASEGHPGMPRPRYRLSDEGASVLWVAIECGMLD